jgi:hypothetical protein
MTFTCIRIYPNGSAKYSVRDEAGARNWLAYNTQWRPGNTLVINGMVIDGTGSLKGNALCEIVDFVLSQELPDQAMRVIGKHWCDIERKHVERYPDDDVLVNDYHGMRHMEEQRKNAATHHRGLRLPSAIQ